MAIHTNNTPSGVNEPALSARGLLAGAPCPTPALRAETVALLGAIDFSPAAIMARADDYAAKQAERVARLPVLDDPRSAVEILEEIRREIEKPELPPEPLLASDVLRGAAGPYRAKVAQRSSRHDIVTTDNPATCIDIDTPDLPQPVAGEDLRSSRNSLDHARARHMRRELEQAARHGTALLATLGLPRLVDAGFAPIDGDALGDALEVVLSHLDAIDAPEEDLESGGDDEPWLAWVTSPSTGCVDTGISADDRELDTADGEPSLGAPEQHEGCAKFFNGHWIPTPADQRHWADGSTSDREAEITDEPHDDQEDEPSIGWPEDYTAKLDDVLQADHDPELDDADLERSFTDACEVEDPVWMTARSTREVAHV